MTSTDPTAALEQAFTRPGPGPLLVGFSGGLDSTVLLHALSQDPAIRMHGLRAMHVHHGLQALADDWAAHCARFCASIGVPLSIVRVNVARDSGDGLEAAARKARYGAFETALAASEVLVTAHHRDDQAETFLLRALRGSGPDGLAAMRPWRKFAAGRHWRPLLETPRDDLLAYAQQRDLPWLDDPSNEDTRHARNFLRQRILPLLRERWPQADAAFARSAVLNADAVELLDQEDALALAMVRSVDPQALSASALLEHAAPRRARVLRRWIEALGFPPLPGAGIVQIESDLLQARADARARFVWRDAVIERWRDLLHAQRLREPLPPGWSTEWDGSEPLSLPGGDSLELEGAGAFASPCRVSARRGGERILLSGRTHSHALKNVLQELGVPPWEREALPLVHDRAGTLVAVADFAYSADFDVWLREQGARLRWRRSP
ncbi:tRNA lysidine(34) synthetase TilS [Pseudoxanthomonas yeongjuensis]|uniref:tRNA lysidine(34) synthetase TilS n=1 Tax=Pseudoxanthomonas yeongjuensis TaxID=377616 RepID=UPI001390CCA8|nr:tRNA lysidine(34) synthetase TilS [Pseudoxanthomonas yeongjuensis]KAF1718291.1 tRNA lysidine(34) synthetase TilS [Pseudoxanthomonas yeongjuensis]